MRALCLPLLPRNEIGGQDSELGGCVMGRRKPLLHWPHAWRGVCWKVEVAGVFTPHKGGRLQARA